MKKILKNKKGFTLVELLAVIVILAIIMVIATQQIGKVIAGARADSFVESYQMVAKQVQTFIATDQTDDIKCDDSDSSNLCGTKYGLSSDYFLKVDPVGTPVTGYKITLSVPGTASNYTGKFANVKLTENGKASNGTTCDTDKIGRGASSCTEKQIEGTININD